MTSILQSWVEQRPILHQATLISAIRGCDTAGPTDPSKSLVRSIRSAVLKPDGCDSIRYMDPQNPETIRRLADTLPYYNPLPTHFVNHVMEAMEILGYYYPDETIRQAWQGLYQKFCQWLHVEPGSKYHMERRGLAPRGLQRHCNNRVCSYGSARSGDPDAEGPPAP